MNFSKVISKQEKNAKVKKGQCIFPFKYKYEEHNSCIDTNKGPICATEVNPKTKTLTKYGYCQTSASKSTSSRKSNEKRLKKGTKKRALKTPIKLNSKSLRKPRTLNKRSKSSSKQSKSSIKKTQRPKSKSRSMSKPKFVIVESLKTKRTMAV